MVRILKDNFWANVETYEDVIRKCFLHLYYLKFPNFSSERFNGKSVKGCINNDQDVQESFDHLLVEFKRLQVFEKFDEKRPSNNFPMSKKFEQFLFKWTEKILFEEYHKRKRRTIRFRRVSNMDIIHRDALDIKDKIKEIFADEPVIDTDLLPKEDKIKTLEAKSRTERLYKKYPTIQDIDLETPTDDIEEYETWNLILNVCQNEQELKAVEYKKEGLDNEAVAINLKCTSSNVSALLKKLCDRYHKNAQKFEVFAGKGLVPAGK